MTADMITVFAILGATIALFVSDRIRLDVVAMLAVLALALTGLVSPQQAVAGFGATVVVIIGGLFVVGEGLFRTGVAFRVGDWLVDTAGTGEARLTFLLMGVVAVLSAFMSSTGAVAIFIPVALRLAVKAGLPPGRLMMPLAFGSLIGGMLTLIGTPPNLVVSTQLQRAGLAPFDFFDFTGPAFLILLLGLGYMLTIGRRLLPGGRPGPAGGRERRSLRDLAAHYGIADKLVRLDIGPGSALDGLTVAEAALRSEYGITVLGFEEAGSFGRRVSPALAHSRFEAGQTVLAVHSAQNDDELAHIAATLEMTAHPLDEAAERIMARQLGLADVLLTPDSNLIGKTLKETRFRHRTGLGVLAVQRKGRPVSGNFATQPLRFGDALLLGGGWKEIANLREARQDLVVLRFPEEMNDVAEAPDKAPHALIIALAMLGLISLELMPTVVAVLAAAVAMVLSGAVATSGLYRAINWPSLVLIAGMLPMATALENSGAMALIVDTLVGSLGSIGPTALLAGLVVLTSVFSQVISNTATTVLVAPMAIGAAQSLGISPYPLLMGVALAASTAFATPVASPVNTLVLGPGGYRFNDFVKVGIPLQTAALILTIATVPVFFPF
ncbi:SLC13 family permease [Roseospirillum parvum]|uniref:TrkA-C domain-containing protein n=1 Tax=Roseospirillum parvum TaxID=83401 RepID=A0A1G7ZY40_9PROT|nr:SLC13 family permease [Roseospirillum parvum]SDH13595.1 TrkA-C domain-containing protein [Roseospirillum parvum]